MSFLSFDTINGFSKSVLPPSRKEIIKCIVWALNSVESVDWKVAMNSEDSSMLSK